LRLRHRNMVEVMTICLAALRPCFAPVYRRPEPARFWDLSWTDCEGPTRSSVRLATSLPVNSIRDTPRVFRHKQLDESPNLGLENKGFRNYADYMLTKEFRQGIEKLLEIARQKRTAILCAEGLFWRCHRRLVSDFLVANGVTVQHIMPTGVTGGGYSKMNVGILNH
jgi:hypothetical protein